jgi:hypothetical protein
MKLYADTHIPKQVAIQLRQIGIDIVRCEEVGLAEADDNEHWEYAKKEERCILTHDTDFLIRADIAWKDDETFFGVIYGSRHLQGNVGLIVKFCLAQQDNDLTNQVLYMQ